MPTILLVGVKLAGETMWSREVCHPRVTPPWPRTRRGTQKTESRDAVVPPLLVRYLGTDNLRADPVHNTVCQYRNWENRFRQTRMRQSLRKGIGAHADEYRSEMAPSRNSRRSPVRGVSREGVWVFKHPPQGPGH